MNKKLKKTLKTYDKSKQNKETLISGQLGISLNGRKLVEVPNRKGFVYVRLKGNTSELIQAYNATVAPVYDLPVFVVRQTGIYKVVGRNIDRHTNQWGLGAYLPKHGAQHSFNHDINAGGDVVWVYGQQFMPLLSYPSGQTYSMMLGVQPAFYEWQGSWRYAQNTGTPDYTPYVPTITGSARMVLSYIQPSDNSIRLVPGTPFDGSITGSAEIAQYIPDIPRSLGIPLAAVRLTTGTTVLDWNAIYDVRDFYTVGNTSTGVFLDTIGFAGLDEGIPLGTGTMLNVTGDLSLTRSGSMFNLNYVATPGGGGGGGGIMGWDEGVPLGTGSVLNVVGTPATLSISGTVLNLSVSQPITTIFDQTVSTNAGQTNFDVAVSGTYHMLKAYIDGRSTTGSANTTLLLSFNNDTTDANYRSGFLRQSSVTVAYTGADDRRIGIIASPGSTRPKASGHHEITILNPFTAAHEKNAQGNSVIRFATETELWNFGLQWENTAPLNKLTFSLLVSNFASGTHCVVYGYA